MAAEDLLARVGSLNLDDVGDEVERLRKENEALKRKVTALEVVKDGAIGEGRGSANTDYRPMSDRLPSLAPACAHIHVIRHDARILLCYLSTVVYFFVVSS